MNAYCTALAQPLCLLAIMVTKGPASMMLARHSIERLVFQGGVL